MHQKKRQSTMFLVFLIIFDFFPATVKSLSSFSKTRRSSSIHERCSCNTPLHLSKLNVILRLQNETSCFIYIFISRFVTVFKRDRVTISRFLMAVLLKQVSTLPHNVGIHSRRNVNVVPLLTRLLRSQVQQELPYFRTLSVTK